MESDHGNAEDQRRWFELWSLREDVEVELPADGPIQLRGRWGEVTIQRPSPQVREMIHRMRMGPIRLENVIGTREEATDPTQPGATRGAQRVQLQRVLGELQPLIIRTLALETAQPLLSIVPLTPDSRFHPVELASDVPVRLSVFAELRTNGTGYRLESPLALHRVLLHRPEAVSLISQLGRPTTPSALIKAWPPLAPVASAALAHLAAAGMVVQAQSPTGPPVFAEDNDPALAGWSPVDLMFHTRSTLGRHDDDVGITYPTGAAESPEPVVKPRRQGPGIPLHRPRWEDLCLTDPPLAVALEGRRSARSYALAPITVTELGDLLYRTSRVRSLNTRPGDKKRGSAEPVPSLSDRPYPGGGACYELELYVTIGECAGLEPGVYHYDPLGHRLEPITSDRAKVDGLLVRAASAAAIQRPPPVLITMTARIRRLSWKYAGLAYSLALADVGVLIQSLYLVCTAMRLAPCALGAVWAETAARAFGTDWRMEPSIGQFIVGRDSGAPAQRSGRWQPANDAQWPDLARARLIGPRPRPAA